MLNLLLYICFLSKVVATESIALMSCLTLHQTLQGLLLIIFGHLRLLINGRCIHDISWTLIVLSLWSHEILTFACVRANNVYLVMVIVKSFIDNWCRRHSSFVITEISCLVVSLPFSTHDLLTPKSLFFSMIFKLFTMLFHFLLSKFFFHLRLKSLLHFSLLHFSFHGNDVFLITTLEDWPLFF